MAGSVEGAGVQQRRAHERMTADQFIWWLRGYLDSLGSETTAVPRADAKAIRDALERVGPYAPPAPAPAQSSLKDALDRATQSRCWRCGTVTLGGTAHFCNGALVNG